ncbi:MAG: cation transporting ATPase C-terminal domain-containing protein [Promethearchaeia archaeon]
MLNIGLLSNKMVIIRAVAVVATMILILYIPLFQAIFQVIPLQPGDWVLVLFVSFAATFWIELVKIYRIEASFP